MNKPKKILFQRKNRSPQQRRTFLSGTGMGFFEDAQTGFMRPYPRGTVVEIVSPTTDSMGKVVVLADNCIFRVNHTEIVTGDN